MSPRWGLNKFLFPSPMVTPQFCGTSNHGLYKISPFQGLQISPEGTKSRIASDFSPERYISIESIPKGQDLI